MVCILKAQARLSLPPNKSGPRIQVVVYDQSLCLSTAYSSFYTISKSNLTAD